jgi:hypothetical protein
VAKEPTSIVKFFAVTPLDLDKLSIMGLFMGLLYGLQMLPGKCSFTSTSAVVSESLVRVPSGFLR